MVDVISTIVIARTRHEVADFAANPNNATKWYANIKSVEWVTPPPLSVGTRLAFQARFLGRKLIYTYEITEFDRGERLVMRTSEGPFPMETLYEWKDVNISATEMVLRNRGEPAGFSVLLAPLMSAAIRWENRQDLARLKRLVEAGATSSNGA